MALRDVTLGQFVPGDSVLHRLDARVKLVCGLVLAAALFATGAWAGYGLLAAYVGLATGAARLPAGAFARGLRPVLWLVALSVTFHALLTPGTPVVDFGPLAVTVEGLDAAGRLAVRLVLLVMGVQLVMMTTSPVALTDALEWLLTPGRRLGLPAHELAMMVTIALRFVPALVEELDRIIKAQKARGAELERGGPISRARALVPILVPLFIGAFRRADALALALESRCYRGSLGRTRWRASRWAARDWTALAGSLVVMVLVGWRFR
mgnify:CR=1 FL=1